VNIQKAPQFQAPRTLSFQSNQPEGNPEPPKGPGEFGDKFMRNLEGNSDRFSTAVMPFAFGIAGGYVGGRVGGMALGQLGSMVGGFGGSYLGFNYSRKFAGKPEDAIDNIGGKSAVARTLLHTAYAGGLTGLTVSLALGGINPTIIGGGAAVATAGLVGYSLYQAARD
jgi:hypothetical protein